jgi:hypothetical protein
VACRQSAKRNSPPCWLADLLERKLKAGRAPEVARRPAAAYGGQTMLELIARDRHRELLETVDASFDWT